jgi:mannose-6-phosphate isomerase-like protein (cupin superfamily)
MTGSTGGMVIRHFDECPEFVAGDHTLLRELLRPDPGLVDARYSLAQGRLDPGLSSRRHLLTVSEVYYFLAGEGRMHVGGESAAVRRGTVVAVPPNTEQWLENTGQEALEFLCLVDPAWTPDCERILK